MAATYRGGGRAETDPSVGPAIAAHNDETTGVHGIPDTAVLATADNVADAVAAEATARATALDAKQNLTEKGEPSGYAALDADGRVLDGSGVPVESTVIDFDVDLGPFAAGKGLVLTNEAGTVVRRVRLNDAGNGLLFEGIGESSWADAVAADVPSAWWRLDEASGTTAADSIGIFDAIWNTAPSAFGVAGLANDAVTLNATQRGAITDDGTFAPGTADFTLEIVFRSTVTGISVMFGKGGGGVSWWTGLVDGVVRAALGGTQLDTPDATYNDGEYHLVQIIRRSSVLYLRVDGELAVSGAGGVDLDTGPAVQLGALNSSFNFTGDLDEVVWYEHGISDERADAHWGGLQNPP